MRNSKVIYACLFLALLACNNNPGKNKVEKIDYIVREAFEDKEFIGNVLVADQGEVIYNKSFGNSDHLRNIPTVDTTKFLVGSISKPITAILILRLVDKGVIRLNDQVGHYFAEVKSPIGNITIHHLLTHTSGINEILTEEKNMEISTLLGRAELKFEPGTEFEYANSGYVILKEIAEISTQKDFTRLVSEEVFLPANMSSSGVARNSNVALLAKGYIDPSQTEAVAINFPFENIDGAGSIYSTIEDLYKLDRALYTENLLSNAMKEKMLKQHAPGDYSYGWFVRERGGVWDVYWHRGSLPGFTSFISRRVQKDQFIVLLSNANDLELNKIENDISKVLKTNESSD